MRRNSRTKRPHFDVDVKQDILNLFIKHKGNINKIANERIIKENNKTKADIEAFIQNNLKERSLFEEYNKELYKALERGNTEKVTELLEESFKINKQTVRMQLQLYVFPKNIYC